MAEYIDLLPFSDVVEGLIETINRVPGFHSVLDYEPNTVQQGPMAYMLFDRLREKLYAGVKATEYDVLIRAVVPFVDNPEAEREIIRIIDRLPNAIITNPYLGGRLKRDDVGGQMMLNPQRDAEGVYVKLGNVLHRALDIYVRVLVKVPAPDHTQLT